MLNIQIDNPELEQSIKQAYGSDSNSIARAFTEFVQQQKIRQDIKVSIEQFDAGEGVPLASVMGEIRAKYE